MEGKKDEDGDDFFPESLPPSLGGGKRSLSKSAFLASSNVLMAR